MSVNFNPIQASETFIWGAKHGAHFFSDSLDSIINLLNEDWNQQPPELQKKLCKIWKYTQNTPVTKDDSLLHMVQKVAFSFFVSLPTSLIFKDFTSSLNRIGLPPVYSMMGCFSYILHDYLYIHVMNTLIDSISKNIK